MLSHLFHMDYMSANIVILSLSLSLSLSLTVFLADGFEYDGSFYVNIIGTDPPMTCACTDAKI